MLGTAQRFDQLQTQHISPRLQLAVRLLQMSSPDFAAAVHDLLGRNPFLESPEDGGADGISTAPAESEASEPPRELHDSHEPSGHESDVPLHGDDRELWNADGRGALRRADEGESDALALTANRIGLRDHLRSQINVLRLSERDRVLACIIAESVDDDGYLRQCLGELAELSGLVPQVDADEMLIALRRVQALDPAGVAARDVAECLRLQLGAIACRRQRAFAREVIDQHMPLLASRDMTSLARKLHITAAEAELVCVALRRLDPRPGARFEAASAPYVVPDVLAFKARGQWQVKLNPAVVPGVRLNKLYEELFRRHRSPEHGEMAHHLHEARWALRNIEQRFATILQVAQAIVQRQRHFLEFGALAMKPLALKDIADEVGVHESTVSRVTSNKFIAAPTGVYELKYFFSRSIVSSNGTACSGTAIRGLIRDLVHGEKDRSPMSDAEIARQLAQQGLVVARRTVTKYRQMLKIDAVERRRQHEGL